MMTERKAKVRLSDLKKIKLVRPKNAKSAWKGVPHYELVSTFMKLMNKKGWKPDGLRIDTFNNEAGVAFCLIVRDQSFGVRTDAGGLVPCLAVTATNDTTERPRVYVGGTFGGVPFVIEDIPGKRYRVELDLKKEVNYLLESWLLSIKAHLRQTLDHLRAVKITEDEAARIVLSITGDNLIPSRYLGGVLKSFHNYMDKSLWSLYACLAKPIGLSPGHMQPKRLSEVFYRFPHKPKPDPVLNGAV